MYIFIVILILAWVVFFHELGHAFAMRSRGIPIAEISIGIPFPGTPSFVLKRVFPGAKFRISPLLLAAYVKPQSGSEAYIDGLSHKDSALINGAGIMANFFFALFLIAVYKFSVFTAQTSLSGTSLFYAIIISIAAALWIFRQFFCQYILPALGPLVILLVGYSLLSAGGKIVGPVGIVQEAAGVKGVWEHVINAANISLGLGLINCLPLFPMDGGRLVSAILKDYDLLGIEKTFRSWGSIIFIVFIVSVILNDILRLF